MTAELSLAQDASVIITLLIDTQTTWNYSIGPDKYQRHFVNICQLSNGMYKSNYSFGMNIMEEILRD